MALAAQPSIAKAKASAPQVAPAAPVEIAQLEAALRAERHVQLKTLIERAKLARQTDPLIDVYLGEYWLANRQAEQALGLFQTLTDDPRAAARAHQGLGIAAFQLGKIERAHEALSRAVELDPSLGRAWNALGATADLRRDWPLAEKAYGEALRIDPASRLALSNRGYSRVLQGRYEEAVTDLTAAIRSQPSDARMRNNLRVALALSGRYDEAFAGINRRDLHRELNNIGFVALLRGDYVSAEAYLNRALETSDVFYRKAWQNLVYLGDLKPAVRLASAK
jgi:Flp pilus assembly protein TadD